MSRFVDPDATERMSLGECLCPGTPHAEGDWLEMRTELGGTEVGSLMTGDSLDSLEALIVDWNMLDKSGAKPPINRDNIQRLYADNFDGLADFIEKHVRVQSVPKASAEPSRRSSRARGSRTRTALKAV